MERIAHQRYEEFNAWRKQMDAKRADAEDMKMLEDLENELKSR